MLKKDVLKQEIQDAFETLLPGAFKEALRAVQPQESKDGNEMAEKFGQVITDLLSEPLAQALASAIDYHVRSADVHGTVIVNPYTHMARIDSPNPLTNGKITNTFGIK